MAYKRNGKKTSVKRIAFLERDRQAIRLRKSGMDYEHIANELGMANRSIAFKSVMRSIEAIIKESTEDAREVVSMELLRLDEMMLGCWEGAQSGDPQMVDRVLKIMERRAKLLGLDLPVKSEVSGPAGGAIEISSPTIYLPAERSDEESTGLVEDNR